MPSEPLVEESPAGEGVVLFSLNRPELRNAVNRALAEALLARLDSVRGAKVVVITGRGTAFCAGLDRGELSGGRAAGSAAGLRNAWLRAQEAIRDHPAVIIAAVNGFALGGGVTLINSCDLAIASADAQIGLPEVGAGAYPALAGPSTQLRLLSKRAAWLILTGARISGATAEQWGLVNMSVAADSLMETTLDVASRVASFESLALQWSKRALREIPMRLPGWADAMQFGRLASEQLTAGVSPDLAKIPGGRPGWLPSTHTSDRS